MNKGSIINPERRRDRRRVVDPETDPGSRQLRADAPSARQFDGGTAIDLSDGLRDRVIARLLQQSEKAEREMRRASRRRRFARRQREDLADPRRIRDVLDALEP